MPIERGDTALSIQRMSPPRRITRLHDGPPGPKVLVVDDQLESRDWLMKLLTFIGFIVCGADNGVAAIQLWEEWNPQMILMDLHMPVMGGIEATRRIKADPRGKETVIVVLTASALDEDRRIVVESALTIICPNPVARTNCLKK
jgi:CheY-like chemotaxis protein